MFTVSVNGPSTLASAMAPALVELRVTLAPRVVLPAYDCPAVVATLPLRFVLAAWSTSALSALVPPTPPANVTVELPVIVSVSVPAVSSPTELPKVSATELMANVVSVPSVTAPLMVTCI